MRWLGWVYICDQSGCSSTKTTTTDDPVDALAEAVRDGWMPGVPIPGRRERIFCPTHFAEAKATAR